MKITIHAYMGICQALLFSHFPLSVFSSSTRGPRSARSVSPPAPSTPSDDWRPALLHCPHENIHRTKVNRASKDRFEKPPCRHRQASGHPSLSGKDAPSVVKSLQPLPKVCAAALSLSETPR